MADRLCRREVSGLAGEQANETLQGESGMKKTFKSNRRKRADIFRPLGDVEIKNRKREENGNRRGGRERDGGGLR